MKNHRRIKYRPDYRSGKGKEEVRPQYIMVHLSFEEIMAAYGKGSPCRNMTDAIETFREDMLKEAEYRGYEGISLFAPVASLYTEWIKRSWEGEYDAESLGSSDPDNDGRRDDSSELEERDDGAGSGEA